MNEIEKYIHQFEPLIRERLFALRQIFIDFNPKIEETIRYKMPAFKVGKHYLYFAAYKKHIGFYPVYGMLALEEQLMAYRAKGTKDSLHFLHNKPLPLTLIKEIIFLKSKQE